VVDFTDLPCQECGEATLLAAQERIWCPNPDCSVDIENPFRP
jgi:hypothetical protein